MLCVFPDAVFFLSSQFSSLPPVRVVFAVTMEGSARKVITVRSALIVKNRLETPMELRLDSPSAPDSKSGWCGTKYYRLSLCLFVAYAEWVLPLSLLR